MAARVRMIKSERVVEVTRNRHVVVDPNEAAIIAPREKVAKVNLLVEEVEAEVKIDAIQKRPK